MQRFFTQIYRQTKNWFGRHEQGSSMYTHTQSTVVKLSAWTYPHLTHSSKSMRINTYTVHGAKTTRINIIHKAWYQPSLKKISILPNYLVCTWYNVLKHKRTNTHANFQILHKHKSSRAFSFPKNWTRKAIKMQRL